MFVVDKTHVYNIVEHDALWCPRNALMHARFEVVFVRWWHCLVPVKVVLYAPALASVNDRQRVCVHPFALAFNKCWIDAGGHI